MKLERKKVFRQNKPTALNYRSGTKRVFLINHLKKQFLVVHFVNDLTKWI